MWYVNVAGHRGQAAREARAERRGGVGRRARERVRRERRGPGAGSAADLTDEVGAPDPD